MRSAKRDALILKLVIAGLALLAVNTLLLVALLLRQGDSAAVTSSPSTSLAQQPAASLPQPGTSPTAPPQAPSSDAGGTDSTVNITGGGPMATVLRSTVEPLAKAASDFGLDLSQVLPGDEQMQACADSGSLASQACKLVLAKLEAGYAQVNMPFPDLASSLSADPDASAPPSAPGAPGSSGSADQDILRAFFSVTVERLERQAKREDMLGAITMPTNDQIQAAVESGAVDSQASQVLLVLLREQYGLVGLTFPEPEF